MSEYFAVNKEGSVPILYVKSYLDDGESFSVKVSPLALSFEDFREIPDEVVINHLDNLTSFIKSQAGDVSLVDPSDTQAGGWPLLGWDKIQEANTELIDWWSTFQYKKMVEKTEAEVELEKAAESDE